MAIEIFNSSTPIVGADFEWDYENDFGYQSAGDGPFAGISPWRQATSSLHHGAAQEVYSTTIKYKGTRSWKCTNRAYDAPGDAWDSWRNSHEFQNDNALRTVRPLSANGTTYWFGQAIYLEGDDWIKTLRPITATGSTWGTLLCDIHYGTSGYSNTGSYNNCTIEIGDKPYHAPGGGTVGMTLTITGDSRDLQDYGGSLEYLKIQETIIADISPYRNRWNSLVIAMTRGNTLGVGRTRIWWNSVLIYDSQGDANFLNAVPYNPTDTESNNGNFGWLYFKNGMYTALWGAQSNSVTEPANEWNTAGQATSRTAYYDDFKFTVDGSLSDVNPGVDDNGIMWDGSAEFNNLPADTDLLDTTISFPNLVGANSQWQTPGIRGFRNGPDVNYPETDSSFTYAGYGQSMKFFIQGGTGALSRSQIVQSGGIRNLVGYAWNNTTHWFGMAMYIPNTWPIGDNGGSSGRTTLFDQHRLGDEPGTAPGFGLSVSAIDGAMSWRREIVAEQNEDIPFSPALNVADIWGRWSVWVFEVKVSKDTNGGLYRVWLDDTLILERLNVTTIEPGTNDYGYYKWGPYTPWHANAGASSQDKTMWIDQVKVGEAESGASYNNVRPKL